ncbi:MAG: tol-pal system protein YbgF [Cupriavidus sp.]|nr:MAG: tol-pal system protein YbgF [Cupriavidus sp.]
MTRSVHGYAIVLLGLSALAGCASQGRVDGGGDVLSPQERRLQTVETRMAEMSRRLDGINYAGLDQDNVKLRDDLRSLRGEVERLRFDFDNQVKRSKDQYQDTDRRLQRLESASAASIQAAQQAAQVAIAQGAIPPPAATAPQVAPAVPSAPVVAAPAAAAGGPVVISNGGGGTPEEEGAYLATFDLLKNGKYDDAIRGFRSMLDKWPQGRYSDNATYWMGEACYVKRDYKSAQTAFQTVLDKFGTSPKVPDAMLKVGLCQIELKQNDQATATLQKVIKTYPAANAANLAKQRLDQLKSSK